MEEKWLRAYVRSLMDEFFEAELAIDDDGDVAFRWGTAACWVSVTGHPFHRVTVFAHAAFGVRSNARLLRELNELNASAITAKLAEQHGTVLVSQTLHAAGVDAETLEQACTCVGTIADDIGTWLAAMFDGQTPFPAEAAEIESEGA